MFYVTSIIQLTNSHLLLLPLQTIANLLNFCAVNILGGLIFNLFIKCFSKLHIKFRKYPLCQQDIEIDGYLLTVTIPIMTFRDQSL